MRDPTDIAVNTMTRFALLSLCRERKLKVSNRHHQPVARLREMVRDALHVERQAKIVVLLKKAHVDETDLGKVMVYQLTEGSPFVVSVNGHWSGNTVGLTCPEQNVLLYLWKNKDEFAPQSKTGVGMKKCTTCTGSFPESKSRYCSAYCRPGRSKGTKNSASVATGAFDQEFDRIPPEDSRTPKAAPTAPASSVIPTASASRPRSYREHLASAASKLGEHLSFLKALSR